MSSVKDILTILSFKENGTFKSLFPINGTVFIQFSATPE